MPQTWRPSFSANTTTIGGTLPRVSKRLSGFNKTNIPRFKRPTTGSNQPRPHSTYIAATTPPRRRRQIESTSAENLATPHASTFCIGDGEEPNSMTSSMVMDSEESRDVVSELQNRCRIRRGYPHLVKAKRLRFYRNGDQYFKGIVYALQSDRVKCMQPLMEDLMKTVLSDSTALPHGIRFIFTIDGAQKISSIDQFEDGGAYVCSSTEVFKNVDYSRAAEPSWRLTLANRKNQHLETKKLALNSMGPSNEPTDFVFPRIIKVIRNGVKPRKIVRHLLNKKTARSYDQVLCDLTKSVNLDSGAIRKIFAVSGREVRCLKDFFGEDDVFVAYGGNEKMAADDLLVVNEEYKTVSLTKSRARRVPHKLDRSGSVLPEQTCQLPNELVGQFEIIKFIGDGVTAVVYEVYDKINEERRALKIIKKEFVSVNDHLIRRELEILKRIDHDYIVGLMEDWMIDENYYLSMELIEMGDLFEHLRKYKHVAERDAARILTCLTKALDYIHSMDIVHRDVKLENLLIFKDAYGEIGVKLGDFGLATQVTDEPLKSVCGTPTYVAPEVLAMTGYGTQVDMWSAGVLLYAILVGYPPFFSVNNVTDELYAAIQNAEFSFPSPSWDGISWSVRHLIMMMLELDPFQRLTASEVLQDEWIINLSEVDEQYEESAQLVVMTSMGTNEGEESEYEYYASRRTSME